MIKWEPKDKGYFISRYKKNLLENNFLKIYVEKIIENTKDILSKSINPNIPKNSGRLSSTNISLESISELFKVDNAIFGSYKYETGIIDISKVSNETSIFSKTSLEVVEFYNNLRSEQNE